MRYASTDVLREDLSACARQVALPPTALDEINARARRLHRRRRGVVAAAAGVAVGAGLVAVPLVRLGDDAPSRSVVLGAGAPATTVASVTPTPEPSTAGGTWRCGATGFDRALVRSAHGAASPEAALRELGYGLGRLSDRVALRPGSVELREYALATGELVGIYAVAQLDDGSWAVQSVQRGKAC